MKGLNQLFLGYLRTPLHILILVAMALGIINGLIIRGLYPPPGPIEGMVGVWFHGVATLGDLFLRLLRMVIVPLVASSIIVGVAAAGDPKNMGRLGFKTFLYYTFSSTAAVFIGLFLTNAIQPGVGVELGQGAGGVNPDDLTKPGSLGDILIRIIPQNPIAALAEADMLSIIFFCLCFGAALTITPQPYKERMLNPIDALFHVMMKLTAGVIRLAPLGVFGLITRAVATLDITFFRSILNYFITLFGGLTLHMFLVLPIAFWIMTRRSPMRHYRNMMDAILTAFSTSSSSATLPVTMKCVEDKAGVDQRISSFVLPLGSTVNMDGSALFECLGALFIAQVLGVELTLGQQVLMIITALLASVGAAGIPSAGLVMIFIVLDAVGLKGPEVGVIVGTMLAVDRPLDMYRTVVNIFSDSVGAVIVAHSEGMIKDEEGDAA